MANNGYQSLGYLLGGGANAAGQTAFMQGQAMRANVDHLSATTQQALEAAKVEQLKAQKAQDEQDQREKLADAFMHADPNITAEQAQAYATFARSGFAPNFGDLTTGRGNLQTQDFRATLGDVNASPDARAAAASAIQGKPVSPYVKIDPESVNAFSPTDASGAPDVQETPLGDAAVDDKVAEGVLKRAQAAKAMAEASDPSKGNKPPPGYAWDPENPGQLKFIPGGPHDPASTAQGARERVFSQRQLGSATQGIASLRNITQLPTGATTGILGVGSAPGHSILASTKGALLHKAASEEIIDYNTAISGLSRNLATLETFGLAPSGSFQTAFDSIKMQPGDTNLNKLRKLAEARQIIDASLDTIESSAGVPEETKKYVAQKRQELHAAIPFTWADTFKLQQSTNPNATIMDMAKGEFNKGSDLPAQNAKGWTLHEDAQGNKAYVSPDGKQYEEVQ